MSTLYISGQKYLFSFEKISVLSFAVRSQHISLRESMLQCTPVIGIASEASDILVVMDSGKNVRLHLCVIRKNRTRDLADNKTWYSCFWTQNLGESQCTVY